MGTDGARARLERAATLTLQTGNLLNWGCLRKKCPATPGEEVSTARCLPLRRKRLNRPDDRLGAGAEPCMVPLGAGVFPPAMPRLCPPERRERQTRPFSAVFFVGKSDGLGLARAFPASRAARRGCRWPYPGSRKLQAHPRLSVPPGSAPRVPASREVSPEGYLCYLRVSEETKPCFCSRGMKKRIADKFKYCLQWQRSSLA